MVPPLESRLDRHLVLAGPMASGKTTLGRILAERMGRPFVDSDEQLARVNGRTARDLAAAEGVEALHAAEVEALIRTLGSESPAVIAAAAAVADSPSALAALAESDAMVILLEGPLTVLHDRLKKSSGHRRAISAAEFEARTRDRRGALLSLDPLLAVDTSLMHPDESADRILEAVDGEVSS
jgi:shikimate kinase